MIRQLLILISFFFLIINISCVDDGGLDDDILDGEVIDLPKPSTGEFVLYINGEQKKATNVKATAFRDVRLEITGIFEDDSRIVIDLFRPNEIGEYEIDGETDGILISSRNNRIAYFKDSGSSSEFQSLYIDEAKGVVSVNLDLEKYLVSGTLDFITLDETFKISKLSFNDISIVDYSTEPESLKKYFFFSELNDRDVLFNAGNAFEGPYTHYYGSTREY